ncbi:CD5 antigen-like [Notamacropus eugenii]|uniref:CD5 antigen-like n=1 Tax=Notamacropus eugenii TaxID=9315 RepID=UPI003B66F830
MVLLFFMILAIDTGLGFLDVPHSLRLVGSRRSCEGRVELWKDGQWGTVCDDHWTNEVAAMVCRELQCGPLMSTPAGHIYLPKAQRGQHVWNLKCNGTEETLAECEEDFIECSLDHSEDVGVNCKEETLNFNEVQLADGPSHCIGRVEMKYTGEWLTVCNEGWTLQDAKVLCRELGCGRPILTKGSCNKDQQGTGNIWSGQMQCQGSEASLNDCPFVPMENNCSHKDDIWVHCEERFALRLVDGKRNCSGRLEVLHKGIWGSVCNDGWGEKEDHVVCQELKCGKAVFQKSRARKSFGHGKGHIWLDDVRCKGKETSLEQCKHRFWGYHDCTHREDVSVICSEK